MADAEPRAFEPPTSERSGTFSKRLTELSETTLISPPESRRA